MAPIVLYEIVFVLVPIMSGVRMSFTNTKLGATTSEYVGTKNFERLYSDPHFVQSMISTFVYALSVVVLAVGVGLVAALLVNGPFRGRSAVRGVLTAPWAFPEIATVLIFIWIFNPTFGVINYLERLFPALDVSGGWLNSSPFAMVAVVLISVWKNFPFYSIVLLAALQSVSNDLHEAARMDGAHSLQRFRHVTLPALAPTLLLLSLLAFVFSFKQFTLIWLTTGGGPARATETLVIATYTNAFKYFDYSYAAAIGVTCLLLTILVTALWLIVQRKVERMEGES
ncbi:carbohydrate ABC transporter permease [Paramicrobacterium chengjingii]|uniref:carbohydrate ABC transporter permease n=1 Tax=Paramicrobacterium chengjingii TaxID=2769067 RepID=UPI00141FB816|nr:sugar ABC transporter permease [Microbacterium chengjingii]